MKLKTFLFRPQLMKIHIDREEVDLSYIKPLVSQKAIRWPSKVGHLCQKRTFISEKSLKIPLEIFLFLSTESLFKTQQNVCICGLSALV